MDRIASLVKRAQGLRRRLWASLPFGFRLARLFESLSDAFLNDWGRQLGAFLLSKGTEGMPDPGPMWDEKKLDPRRLPRGYMKDAANVAYRIALKKLGNPEDAVDVLQDVIVKAMTGGIKLDTGVPLNSALSYIRQTINWACLNRLRERGRHKNLKYVNIPEDEEGRPTFQPEDTQFLDNPYWVEDPAFLRDLHGLFDEGVWRRKVVPELSRIHRDLPTFFDLKLENPDTPISDIVKQLPGFSQSPKSFIRLLRQKVQPKLKELAEELS
jgi:hypothetical protein